MYLHGYYYNQHNEKIGVYILTEGDRTIDIEIGSEESGISFTDDPVEITSQVNDTFDHLLLSQANIRLLCRDYQPGFFCSSCREAVVNIYRDNECLFAGYIEPQAFSQGYNEELDEVELTCIDCLSALQYSNYQDIGSLGVSYSVVKAKAQQRTFLDIAREILQGVAMDVDIVGGKQQLFLFYDQSKAVEKSRLGGMLLSDISINELLFLGDDEDDTWTDEEVLTEILKYLDLHIVQEGLEFYLFSWGSIRKGGSLTFRDIMQDNAAAITYKYSTIDVKTDLVADCDTQISIAQTYNQLLLTDDVTEVENVVESPLDSDSLITQGNFQKYMTEYISEGEGSKAYNGIKDMCLKGSSGYDGASQVDWFCWPKAVKNWTFYGGASGKRFSMYENYPANGTQQQKMLNEGLTQGIGACVCAFGKIERKNGGSDNSPVTSVSMDNYLVISTMGDDRDSSQRPTEAQVLAACPVAEYSGNVSGGTFSPADEETTNYIVISGKMVLNPIMAVTAPYDKMNDEEDWKQGAGVFPKYWHETVPSRNNGDGRYYTRQYWKAAEWRDEPTQDAEQNKKTCYESFYPYTDTGPQNYEFNYSAENTYTDTISKVGLVACMLIIGDKCVVEKPKGETLGTDKAGTGNGDTDDFVWRTYKERSECASDDEYYQQSFVIGFDPKLKDKILGTEFDIQKNAPYTKGVTAEGTAIPIRMSDHVSGQVRFKILGPVNAEWNQVTRRHPSFWRHTKWSSESVLLLQKTNAILMKDFKMEVVSDNGKIGAVSDESDIVYMSDTKEGYINKKDDLEMKITTALTSSECKQLGVNNAVKLSSPHNEITQNALLTIYDATTNTQAKPEQLYVDAYWREWHEPRVEMKQNLIDVGGTVSLFNLYRNPAIGKTFYVEGISRNLTEGTAEVKMKEVF